MVSIIPAERTPWDVLGRDVGSALQQVLPGAVQQGYQRQTGLNALDQAQKEIASAQGDPYKIAMAFARAGAQNPDLARSLGPLAQTAMSQAAVNRAFPQGPGGQGAPASPTAAPQAPTGGQSLSFGGAPPPGMPQAPSGAVEAVTPQAAPSTWATPSPFNIFTPGDIEAESKRYAQAVQDPNAFATRQAMLQNQNQEATQQRQNLEQMALNADIPASELPRFMLVGSKFDTRNPAEWAQKTKQAYKLVKSNDDKIEKTFIPGIGSGLLGKDRPSALKRLEKTVQDQVELGLEGDVREKLAKEYLSPTEIESLIHPIQAKTEKAIQKFPQGDFKIGKPSPYDIWGYPEQPKVSYEEMLEKNPEKLQKQQNELSNFFLKNIDPNTSLLVMREKLWKDKGYDWRQIGPAIREAISKGLKLSQSQSTEMSDIETQPPLQSLPDIFQDWDRVVKYLRGNK